MLQHAFKEWAVICEALGLGLQSIILRKGGIAEDENEFGVEQTKFWLYPTYVHQQRDGVNEELSPLLESVEAHRAPAGRLQLRHWAEVTGIYHLRDELPALLLSHLHGWSEDTIRKRFNYRMPGLHLLVVRVFQSPQVHDIAESSAYAGCRSWVELDAPLAMDGSTPVLDDESFRIVRKQLDLLLTPTALA